MKSFPTIFTKDLFHFVHLLYHHKLTPGSTPFPCLLSIHPGLGAKNCQTISGRDLWSLPVLLSLFTMQNLENFGFLDRFGAKILKKIDDSISMGSGCLPQPPLAFSCTPSVEIWGFNINV